MYCIVPVGKFIGYCHWFLFTEFRSCLIFWIIIEIPEVDNNQTIEGEGEDEDEGLDED